VVGRPNAGKSTLVNALVGVKVAITSDTPQTTRHRLRAIIDLDDAQIVLVDTPGLHKPHDALGEEFNRSSVLLPAFGRPTTATNPLATVGVSEELT